MLWCHKVALSPSELLENVKCFASFINSFLYVCVSVH